MAKKKVTKKRNPQDLTLRALRVADKLLGLPVEQLLKRLADAVRRGESERIVEVIRVAAVAKFEESMRRAMDGNFSGG